MMLPCGSTPTGCGLATRGEGDLFEVDLGVLGLAGRRQYAPGQDAASPMQQAAEGTGGVAVERVISRLTPCLLFAARRWPRAV